MKPKQTKNLLTYLGLVARFALAVGVAILMVPLLFLMFLIFEDVADKILLSSGHFIIPMCVIFACYIGASVFAVLRR
ncbi:MAG: hypothetical protein KDB27_18290 [Planctomycetales bacterium]|nr:hypothetical protein [Planctomycetales bacterium]